MVMRVPKQSEQRNEIYFCTHFINHRNFNFYCVYWEPHYMNERIKELAEQAGMQPYYKDQERQIERFAELIKQDLYQAIGKSVIEQINSAVLRERESCAKLCESMGVYPELNVWNGGPDWYKRQKECAAAIRTRSEPSPAFKNYIGDNWAGIV